MVDCVGLYRTITSVGSKFEILEVFAFDSSEAPVTALVRRPRPCVVRWLKEAKDQQLVNTYSHRPKFGSDNNGMQSAMGVLEPNEVRLLRKVPRFEPVPNNRRQIELQDLFFWSAQTRRDAAFSRANFSLVLIPTSTSSYEWIAMGHPLYLPQQRSIFTRPAFNR